MYMADGDSIAGLHN